MYRAIPTTFLLLVLSSLASAQIRMTKLDEVSQEVTIRNFSGSTTVDISGYLMCREPGTYQGVSTLAIVGGGDLNLSPAEEVTIVYTQILFAGTGIGLYSTSGFSNPANMADFMQFKGVAGFRESVAVSAGIWTAGTFATGDPGPYFYTGNGTSDNGAAFWTNAPAAPVPTLASWALAGLATTILAAGLAVMRGGPATVSQR